MGIVARPVHGWRENHPSLRCLAPIQVKRRFGVVWHVSRVTGCGPLAHAGSHSPKMFAMKKSRSFTHLALLASIVSFLSGPALLAAQSIFIDGFEESCLLDNDGDRLSNCQEAIRLTNINDPDTDDDGLRDGDEVLGTVDGLNLSAMGVNPRRKDILIEHDWSDDANGCAAHSHKPSQVVLNQITQVFASAPVSNPNGQSGINVIHDVGQGGLFTGGNLISIPNGTLQGNVFGADFPVYKASNIASNRIGYFRYAIHAHRYSEYPTSSGYAEIVGDDFLVTLQCFISDNNIRNTIMHELGHNIGLLHGGDTDCNDKPNYNSVMNYRFQFSGVDANCDRFGDGAVNFSNGVRPSINENSVNESAGVCGGPAIDWNGSGTIQDGIQIDLNPGQALSCGGQFTTLNDFNDWANLILSSLPGSPGGGAPAGGIECQTTPSM